MDRLLGQLRQASVAVAKNRLPGLLLQGLRSPGAHPAARSEAPPPRLVWTMWSLVSRWAQARVPEASPGGGSLRPFLSAPPRARNRPAASEATAEGVQDTETETTPA